MKRAWQRMLSGRRLEILNPSPLDIEIEDIAHGLSFLARWNGQTIGDYPFSVAQHSLSECVLGFQGLLFSGNSLATMPRLRSSLELMNPYV